MSKRSEPNASLTVKQVDQAWYEHMERQLSLDSINWDTTILIARRGKTYRFVITKPIVTTRTTT